ncbi:hypothetical protein SDC9_140359 [bioreactor metagenome]|uniref:Uncharacterized protein n=1 Tax=bioreactor metagenome TaxID=1076179 RepID=A0A645DX92_9ZZZZ
MDCRSIGPGWCGRAETAHGEYGGDGKEPKPQGETDGKRAAKNGIELLGTAARQLNPTQRSERRRQREDQQNAREQCHAEFGFASGAHGEHNSHRGGQETRSETVKQRVACGAGHFLCDSTNWKTLEQRLDESSQRQNDNRCKHCDEQNRSKAVHDSTP